MQRDIYKHLIAWKTSPRRKPLLLKGARQTGKTYLLKAFGEKEYAHCFYFNFEEDAQLKSFFEINLDPVKIIENLSLYVKQSIEPKNDLIIFDEIQESNQALNSLKYFCEKANDFHIAAAGSLLGVKLSTPKSFPVGKVNFLTLYPMTFFEFLDAIGESALRNYSEELIHFSPIPLPFHERLIELLRIYAVVGGMPEAVHHYSETKDLLEIRKIQKEIINSYVLDFAKHAEGKEVAKLSHIWESIPMHLSRENKKFIFSAIKESARAREYDDALIWLENAGLIYRAFPVHSVKQPLKGYMQRNSFKVYALDVGLLGSLANIPVQIITERDKLFHEYNGSFTENYVAQHLTFMYGGDHDLTYWKQEGKEAEVDFLCELHDSIYPLEVKAGINPKSKSLRSYDELYNPTCLVRSTLLNLKKDGKICNIPLYAILLLPQLLKEEAQ